MLGYESENRLKNLLVAVGDGERTLEASRARLCSIRDFAPHSGFQRLDRDANGYISSYELLNFLKDHRNFSVSESECFRLVKFFDSDEDNRLSFQDFLQMLLPCEDNLLRNITIDRPACRVGRFDSLACDIESALLDVIEKEIDLQRRLDVLKRELETRYDYSTLAAYRSVDKYNDGRIDTHNLGSFLRSTGHYASERELLAIVRRIDTDGDARLSYAEFSDFVRSAYPPARAEPEPRSSPIRSSPVRSSPVRCVPCSPVRCSPVRCSPVRYSPVRCSPVRCSPVRCSPVKPILHVPEEDALVNGLRDIIALERELESTKVALTNKPDFNLHDAFRIFDVDFRGYISAADVREGLSAIGVFPTSDEVDLFLARYDANKDLRLNFNEFADAFLSTDSYYSHMLNRRPSNHKHPIYRRDDCFYADTQVEFRNMWRVHFKVEVAAEGVRQHLQRLPCFNVYEAFNSLDLNDDGRVNASEIKRIIESRGFYVSEKEASSALDKFDKHKMGSVTYSEFREEILPKSPVRH